MKTKPDKIVARKKPITIDPERGEMEEARIDPGQRAAEDRAIAEAWRNK